MGPKTKRSSSSTPPPPPPSDDITATVNRALDTFRQGNHSKALKMVKENLSKYNNSRILHRLKAQIHFNFANAIGDSNSNAKLIQLRNSLESIQRAIALSPNSLLYSHFHILVHIELCKDNKEYDRVIQECDRALSIEDPIDPLNDALRGTSEPKGSSRKSRTENFIKEIRKFKNKMNAIKILDDDGEEERIKFRSSVVDQREGDSELKKLIKKNEKNVKELEKRIEKVRNLRRKLDLDIDFESNRLTERKKLEGGSKRSIANVRRTEQMRKYWNERMSDESKKRLLRVRIDELEQHFDKNRAARKVLMEAIGFAKEKKTWKFWECRSCGEKFDDCEVGAEHYEEKHVGVFPEDLRSVFPSGVNDVELIGMIENVDWRPVDTAAAVKIIENKAEDDDDDVIPEWPLSDDHTTRKTLLERIHSKLSMLMQYNCVAESLVKRVLDYARLKLRGVIPVSKFGVDKTLHCLCFLGVSELNCVHMFLEEVFNLCDIDRLIADEVTGDYHVLDIIERIAFSSDFNCLLLDDRLLRGGIIRDMYENAVIDDDSAKTCVVDVVDYEMTPISDDIIDWLFMYFPIEEQLATWTQLRGDKVGGTEVFKVIHTEFLNLKEMGERKCDVCDRKGLVLEVENICREEERKMKQFPECEPQSLASVLRERQRELVERDGDAVFIKDILEEALSLSFKFKECGKDDDWTDQDCLDQVNRYIKSALLTQKSFLFDELVKIDAMIKRRIVSMIQIRVKLRRMCVYDYRSIMLPLLKLFIQAHLEDLVDKDASEKSDAAREALLAELALDAKQVQQKSKEKKKKKDGKKPKEFKETGGNEDLQLHQEDAEQVDVPVPSVSADELEEEEFRHEQKLLDEKLEYQRRFEIEAKEKHLSEKNIVPVNMKEGVPDKQFNSEVSGVSSSYYRKSQQGLLVDETGIPKLSSGFPVSTIKGTMGKSSSVSGTQWRIKRSHSHDKSEQGPPNQAKPEGALPSDQRKESQDSDSGALLTEKEMHEGGSSQIEGFTRVKSLDQDNVQRTTKTFQEQEDFPLKEEQKLPEKSLDWETEAKVNDNNKSIGVGTGLKNDIGCVLKVNIQSLWNLRRFRDEFMAVPESMHDHDVGHPCVVCELRKVFSQLSISATEMQKEAVDPTSFKMALGCLLPYGTSFMEAQTKDASEVLAFIFESLHQSFNSGFAASVAEIEGKNFLCFDCTSSVCLVHKLFGLSILEKMNCDNCDLESRCRKETTCFHKINAGELRRMKSMHGDRSFDELLKRVVMNHEFSCHSEEGRGCGNLNHIRHILFTLPHFFTTVLRWQTNSEIEDDTSATLRALTAEIDLGLLYPNLVPGYKYCIVSVVCYHELHYICFAYSHESKTWIMYDEEIEKVIGCWGDVLNKCKEEHYQPQVLFFEAVSQVKDIKLEPTCTYHDRKIYTLGGSIL